MHTSGLQRSALQTTRHLGRKYTPADVHDGPDSNGTANSSLFFRVKNSSSATEAPYTCTQHCDEDSCAPPFTTYGSTKGDLSESHQKDFFFRRGNGNTLLKLHRNLFRKPLKLETALLLYILPEKWRTIPNSVFTYPQEGHGLLSSN